MIKRRKSGVEKSIAIEEACRDRIKPILLTSLTSIAALFPISLGIGPGSNIHQSLAICIIGGLIANSFLTLNVIPVIYTVIEDCFFGKNKSN